jgi:hypothetical protein
MLRRFEEALQMRRDVYSGYLKLLGEHGNTLIAALNYAVSLHELERYAEVKALLRKTISVARRVGGEGHETTLKMRLMYAVALCNDTGATLDDLGEAVTSLEDTERTARRVLGGAHPLVVLIESELHNARASSAARDERRRRVDGLLLNRRLFKRREVDRSKRSRECWRRLRHHPRRT